MMKNVFIGGVARSGKSTLSKRLQKEGDYNHIPLDYFTASIKEHYPDTKITSKVVIDPTSSKNLALLLSNVIEVMNHQDEKFIIDSAHIYPEDIIPYLDKEKWDIYYLGYPNIHAEDKLRMIRMHDNKYDWTHKKTDEELMDILNHLIQISKKLKSDCERLGITFIDTSDQSFFQ